MTLVDLLVKVLKRSFRHISSATVPYFSTFLTCYVLLETQIKSQQKDIHKMAHVYIRPPKSLQMCTSKRIITIACSRLQARNEQRSLKLMKAWHRLY